MTRTILSSLAIAATVSMAAPAAEAIELKKGITSGAIKSAPTRKPAAAVPRQLKSNQRAVPCDCTNCSAPHCRPEPKGFVADSIAFGVEREMKESKKAPGLRRKLRRW